MGSSLSIRSIHHGQVSLSFSRKYLGVDAHDLVAVYLANKSNPTSFADFNQITPFLQLEGEGLFCLPLGFTSPNATGLQNGENVTIQILYDGGDGNLYQVNSFYISHG